MRRFVSVSLCIFHLMSSTLSLKTLFSEVCSRQVSLLKEMETHDEASDSFSSDDQLCVFSLSLLSLQDDLWRFSIGTSSLAEIQPEVESE